MEVIVITLIIAIVCLILALTYKKDIFSKDVKSFKLKLGKECFVLQASFYNKKSKKRP